MGEWKITKERYGEVENDKNNNKTNNKQTELSLSLYSLLLLFYRHIYAQIFTISIRGGHTIYRGAGSFRA